MNPTKSSDTDSGPTMHGMKGIPPGMPKGDGPKKSLKDGSPVEFSGNSQITNAARGKGGKLAPYMNE